jgi:hypothetical protein
MPGERLKRKRIVGASIESVPGTAEVLDATDAAMNCYDAVIQQEVDYTPRPKQGSMSQIAPIPGALKGKATFKCDLIGGATSYLTTLLQGCGCGLTTGVIAPESIPPTGARQHGRLKQIHGAQGNAVIRMKAGEPCFVEFEFFGVWDAPTDAAAVTPTYPTTAPVKFVSGSMTLAAWALKTQKLDFDFGNEVVYRYDGNAVGGICMAAITDRNPKISIDSEATLVSDNNIYGIATATTHAAFSLTLGAVAIAAPAVVPKLPTEGERDGLETDDTDLILCGHTTDTGDDEWTITFT